MPVARLLRFVVTFLALVATDASPAAAQGRTRHVVLIVTDGLRWQEVFTGAERALVSRKPGGVRDTTALLRDFWRDTPQARREALLPFLWGTIAKQGVIYGNRMKGGDAHITNTMKFSYPGYNEIFTGAFDPRIDSNDYPPNPNETVFEWLHGKPGFRGKVAAVATWDVFGRILNRERARFPVLDGWDPPFASAARRTPRMQYVDDWYRTSVKMWDNNAFDAPMHMAAKAIIDRDTPRLLFVGYGETDEWAHSGMYDLLLRSAHQVDAFIADLWRTLQAMPQYRGTTTFVVTTDHGRGSGPDAWRDHGQDVDGAEHIWMAILGPDTPALGERVAGGPVTQAQVAATVAALLGHDWNARNPRAGPPVREAIAGK
ncbi:MAG TPA: alkaline phosphatase family protein [Gemmatimonadaceae bacterium]|nr:alkaline phosphatase family protein [Gemmatimonadaceae bacterium]